MSIAKKIEEIEKRLSELNDPNFYSNYLEGLQQVLDKLQDDRQKAIESINRVRQEESETIISIRKDKERLQSLENSLDQLINIATDTISDENVNLDELAREESQKISSLDLKIKELERYLEFQLRAEIERLTEKIELMRTQILDQAGKIVESDEDFDAVIEPEKKALNEELEILKKQKFEDDTTAEDIQAYLDFKDLSEEDQQAVIDKQKEKTTIVATTPSDKIQDRKSVV